MTTPEQTDDATEFNCDHCGAPHPVGGLTETTRDTADGSFAKHKCRLCEVCMNTHRTNRWLAGGAADSEAIDRAMIANIIRKDIQQLFRRMVGVRT